MPHLTYGHYRWRIGGDELAVLLVWTLFGHMLWIVITMTYLSQLFTDLTVCLSGGLVLAYLLIALCLHFIICIVDLIIARKSVQGTMVETEKRHGLGMCVTLRFSLSLIQGANVILGIVGLALTSYQGFPCGNHAERFIANLIIFLLLLFSQMINSILVFTCCQLCTFRSPSHQRKATEDLEVWERRLRRITRWLKGKEARKAGGIQDVAEVMVKFFGDNEAMPDIVASDLMAGLLLVRADQRAFRQEAHDRLLQRNSQQFESDITGFEGQRVVALLPRGVLRSLELNYHLGHGRNAHLLRTLARLSVFADFPYSSPHLLPSPIGETCTRLSKLLPGEFWQEPGVYLWRGCWCGCSVAETGKNFCSSDLSNLSARRIHFPRTALVTLSTQNDLHHKPYYIFVDNLHREVIVSIRGTAAIEDAITDALCTPESMEETGRRWGFNGTDRWAHDGMLRVAQGLCEEWEGSAILHTLIQPPPPERELSGPEAADRSPYRLILTGHSLGAGIAVLLTCMLKAAFSSIRCYAFGTPGAVVDQRTASELRPFVTSIVLGNDLICRTSFRSLCQLRENLLDAICRARRPKIFILRALTLDYERDELLYPPGEEPDSPFKRRLEKFKEEVRPTYEEVEEKELCIAGIIVHFVRVRAPNTDGRDAEQSCFEMTFGQVEDYKEISVSSTMVTDHLPNRYYTEINLLARAKLRETVGELTV